MKVSSVISLVAATVFAVGIVGPAVAQTPAPAPAPAAPKSDAPADKMEKKDGKSGAHKQHATKKKPAAKKSDDTKASESKAPPEQPKK
jgi:hypothetical protein